MQCDAHFITSHHLHDVCRFDIAMFVVWFRFACFAGVGWWAGALVDGSGAHLDDVCMASTVVLNETVNGSHFRLSWNWKSKSSGEGVLTL